MERILAIRLRALGDVVLTTPALRALALGHPGAELDVVTEPPYVPLLEGLPGIHRVHGLARRTGATLALIRALRRGRYDLAVDFFGNPRSALVARWSGARRTAGYDLRGRRVAYGTKVPRNPPSGEREYAPATHVRLARAVGGRDDGVAPRVALAPGAESRAEALLGRAGITAPERAVGLVAAGTWGTKTWPSSHAAALARRLLASGREVLLLSGPGEERLERGLVAQAPGTVTLPACGVAELAAVIRRLGAVVGTDSGPRHLAVAFSVPTFSWFGPTHPGNWTPPGDERHAFWQTDLPCRACGLTVCPHWSCLPSLAPERATALVLHHLDRHVPAPDLGPAARA
jgi:ADP-heptose:LPS heptosyltransferase